MKIALISLARRGGIVHFHAELANSLIRITQTVAITAAAAPAKYYSPRVPRITLDAGRGGFDTLLTALNPVSWSRILRQLRGSEADLMHVTGVHELNPMVGVMIKALRIPLVYTMHDPHVHRGTSIALRTSNWLMPRLADAVVVLTNHGKRQLLAQGFPAQKIFLIPHGMYSFFTKWSQPGIKPEKMVLFFGRLEAYKGLDILLRAFARLRERLPDWRLTIAGNGRLPPGLKQSPHLGIDIVNKFLTDQEVARLMQRARLVVLPYTEATQSGVIAAAYAFGRPVVTTDVGGLHEMVREGKTGLLIPPNDADALVEAIYRLASDSRRLSQMGRNARTLSHREWNWPRITRLHKAMYSKVLVRQAVHERR